MACRPAPAAQAMRDQADRLWPRRSQASDGICASLLHRILSPRSDHNDGHAVDITHDPGHGVDCRALTRRLMADRRVTYLIFDRRIWSRERAAEGWRYYGGSNPHATHMHVSLDRARSYDTSPWFDDPEEDDLTPEQAKQLKELHDVLVKGVTTTTKGKRIGDAMTHMTTVRNHTTKIARKLGLKVQ